MPLAGPPPQGGKQLEGIENTLRAYDANSEAPRSDLGAFHNPGLLSLEDGTNYGTEDPAEVDAVVHTFEYARHDFWAGLHTKDGVWLYRWLSHVFESTGQLRQAWLAYQEGLELLREPRRTDLHRLPRDRRGRRPGRARALTSLPAGRTYSAFRVPPNHR